MLVKILLCQISIKGLGGFKQGDEVEVDEKLASALINARMAEPVKAKAAPKSSKPKPEKPEKGE